jgi:hypothetical protein
VKPDLLFVTNSQSTSGHLYTQTSSESDEEDEEDEEDEDFGDFEEEEEVIAGAVRFFCLCVSSAFCL